VINIIVIKSSSKNNNNNNNNNNNSLIHYLQMRTAYSILIGKSQGKKSCGDIGKDDAHIKMHLTVTGYKVRNGFS
jgi:hypothetical protein